MVALTTKAKLLKRHFDHAIHGADVLEGLKHFRRCLRGPLILIWDRLSAHRGKVVQEWIESQPDIFVEWLPPYAPNLNPEELCHGNVKMQLRGAMPETIQELRQLVNRGFARLRRRPEALIAFFHHAGLQGVNLIS